MKRLFILMPVLAVLFAGCDALDTVPLSQISPSAYFKTETDLQMFSNSFYSSLLDTSPYDTQSDVLVQSTLSSFMYGGNHRTVPATGGSWTWTTLRKINTLIEYIPQCEDEAAQVKYMALSRFFRAFFYFEKIIRFGDVPWYETQLDSDSEELYKARDSREYVMTKMLEDIDYAIENLGDDTNVYRADKWAALALKSRFCLFEGTFRKYHGITYAEHDYNYYLQQSADAAYELMTTGGFKLYSTGNPDQDYLFLFAEEDANTDEYIFAIKFDYGLSLCHNATAYCIMMSQGQPGFTRKFVNTYLMADGSRFTDKADWATQELRQETGLYDSSDNKDNTGANLRDPRMYQTFRTPGYCRLTSDADGQNIKVGTTLCAPDFGVTCTGYQPIKFVQAPEAASGNMDRNDRSTCDLPVYRLAEVYLNYAEAKAELGTLTQDDLDISVNLIRARAGMPSMNMAEANANPDWYLSSEEYGYYNVTGANQGVILEIRRERTIEMVMEGYRLWDLIRWKCGPCCNQDITGMYFENPNDVNEYDLDGDGEIDTVFYVSTNTSSATSAAAYQINSGVLFSGDRGGNVSPHKNVDRDGFDEERDYYYPIPSTERTLNPNLTQNPGWNDGLDF